MRVPNSESLLTVNLLTNAASLWRQRLWPISGSRGAGLSFFSMVESDGRTLAPNPGQGIRNCLRLEQC